MWKEVPTIVQHSENFEHQSKMTSQIVRILLLATLAFTVPAEGRASSGSYASSSSSAGSVGGGQAGSLESGATNAGYNTNGGSTVSSGAYPASSGYNNGASALPVGAGNGGGHISTRTYPNNGVGTSGGASAIASSMAGSFSGSGVTSGSNTAPTSGNYASNNNAIPNSGGYVGNPGSPADGYQGNPNAGSGAYGAQKPQGFPFNLPQGCFSGIPNFDSDPFQIHQQIMNQIQRLHEENLRLSSQIAGGSSSPHTGQHNYHYAHTNHWVSRDPAATIRWLDNFYNFWPLYFGPAPYYYNPWAYQRYFYTPTRNGVATAFASGNIGPQGGYGSAGVLPQDPGSLFVRFGDSVPGSGPVGSIAGNIPPPSGGTYGISTSSRSGSTTINGQTKTYKDSQVTVNDNGKITTYKAHNP